MVSDTVSIKQDDKEQNAYIPYTYARNCIARITGDMTDMKTKHLSIVKVNNNLGGGIATSLHFHGFKMDKERFILAY